MPQNLATANGSLDRTQSRYREVTVEGRKSFAALNREGMPPWRDQGVADDASAGSSFCSASHCRDWVCHASQLGP